MTHTVVAVVGVVVAKAALAYVTRRHSMKITRMRLKQIIKEELGSDPEGEAASFAQLRKAKSAEKLNTSVEEVEIIADLMANDPEFRMFRNFVDKFKRYSQSGGAVASSLEAALPEYMPGKMIARLVAKAQESLTGDETPMAQPKSPAASAADMDNWESDYRNESKLKENNMKITKKQLKRIIKEEMMNEGLHYEGLMEIMVDALKSELGSWQPEAKAQVYEELASKGLDLTKVALNMLDDDAGRNPGGSIGE